MSTTNSGPRVAIIGGGIQGAASAYYLTDRGAQVTLIEGSTIAAGASGKAGGLLALDWHGKHR
jgi:glycine/D-amino acid oxidase-like deaminating enzyme